MKNRFIIFMALFAGIVYAQPTLQSNAQIFGAKTYFRGGMTAYRGLTLSGSNAYTNLFIVSDSDSLKFRMFKYLYPIEMEIGNTQKFAVDSAGNVIAAGNVTATGNLVGANVTTTTTEANFVADGDSLIIDPHQGTYPLKLGIGGARKFSVDSAGWVFATSFSSPTSALTTITGAAATNATAINSKITIGNNYPLVSTSSIKADSLTVTAGNMSIIDIDSVATAGGVNRWYKITFSKAGATGKPAYGWFSVDTATVK